MLEFIAVASFGSFMFVIVRGYPDPTAGAIEIIGKAGLIAGLVFALE